MKYSIVEKIDTQKYTFERASLEAKLFIHDTHFLCKYYKKVLQIALNYRKSMKKEIKQKEDDGNCKNAILVQKGKNVKSFSSNYPYVNLRNEVYFNQSNLGVP